MVLLAVALACFAVLPAVVVLGTRGQSAERAGVARSILTIERRYATAMDVTAERSFHERVLAPLAARLGNLGTTLTPTAAVRRLQRQLDYAGNPATWPVERVVAAKGIGLVAGLGGGALFGLALGGGRTLLLAALCGGALGFLFPDISIYNAGVKRQDAMRSSLPDVLDTLTICVEAGQGFDAALAQVSRNGRGPMAGETARVLQEMRIGKSRVEAMRAMAARTTVDELRGFASSVIQASELGVPIGNVLREQSREMRTRRRQMAEEKAQKVPIKILFPTLFLLFPSLFIVILGPAVLKMMG